MTNNKETISADFYLTFNDIQTIIFSMNFYLEQLDILEERKKSDPSITFSQFDEQRELCASVLKSITSDELDPNEIQVVYSAVNLLKATISEEHYVTKKTREKCKPYRKRVSLLFPKIEKLYLDIKRNNSKFYS